MASFEWPSEGAGGGGVTSLNTETGDITLVGGTNVTVTPVGQNITISSSPGTTGDLTDVGTDGITIGNGGGAVLGTGTTISQHVADTSHNGYLSSADWNTFNGKQPSGTYVTAISVASTNGLAGTSSGGSTPALTLSTSITGILSGNGTAISAAATTGSGSVVLATSPTIVTPTIAKLANLTSNGYVKTSGGDGTLSVQGVPIPVADGGTGQTTAAAAFNALSPITTTGDIIYSPSGATSQRLGIGSTGNVLTVSGGVPAWAPPATAGTVTTVSVVSANGFSGTVATATTTPAITLSYTGTGLVEELPGMIESPTAKIYTLDLAAAYGYTINTLNIQTVSGTCTAAIKINGTNVTSISAVSVSSTLATATATGANTVSAGNTVTLVISSVSTPVDLSFTLKVTRT